MFGLGKNYIVKTDQVLIYATKNGYKPACLIRSRHPKINYKNCDVVSFQQINGDGKVVYHDYLLNRKKVSNIIKNNKAVFTTRLGINPESSIENIYKIIEEKLKTSFQILDLEGMILGFPKQNSMIYNLEKFAGLRAAQRKNPKKFKAKLLEALRKEDSPYANLSTVEKEELENSIKRIGKVKEFNNSLYDFIEYVYEPTEMNRIRQTTAEYKKESKLWSRYAQN